MKTVNSEILHAHGGDRFSCDASDAGFAPGKFALEFMVQPKFGNGQKFLATRALKDEIYGEVYGAEYMQELGCVTIVVYND